MLLARGSGMTLTTAAARSLRALEAGVAGRLSRNCTGDEGRGAGRLRVLQWWEKPGNAPEAGAHGGTSRHKQAPHQQQQQRQQRQHQQRQHQQRHQQRQRTSKSRFSAPLKGCGRSPTGAISDHSVPGCTMQYSARWGLLCEGQVGDAKHNDSQSMPPTDCSDRPNGWMKPIPSGGQLIQLPHPNPPALPPCSNRMPAAWEH